MESLIDLNDLDVFAERVPHDWFTWLRHNAPVWHHPEPGGQGFWVVTRWADVVAIGKNPQTFANAPQQIGLGQQDEFVRAMTEAAIAAIDVIGASADHRHLLTLDPPEHTYYRKLLNKRFTPRQVRVLESHIVDLARRRIARVIERGECDFVADLAMPLPMEAIFEMLGIPAEDHESLLLWSNQVLGSADPEYAVTPQDAAGAFRGLFTYFDRMNDDRRARPHDDLVSVLVDADLSRDRFRSYVLLLVLAGNETTRNALSHGMYAFMTHPDQRRLLIERPDLIGSAVEEVLRWASPVIYMRRNVTEPAEVAGVRLEPGEIVSVWYPSANYDEAVFEDPHAFDITRNPNEHIAFGGGGPHFCLGAHLARLEIAVMLGEIMRAMPDMEPAGEPERLRNNHINGVKHLPVRFTPRSAALVERR